MTTLRDLTIDDLGALGTIMTDAFTDDPAMRWFYDNPPAVGAMMKILAKDIYFPKGFGHILSGGEGATLWLPPGAKEAEGPWTMLRLAGSAFRYAGVGGVRRLMAAAKAAEAVHPKEPHYYLFAIGVRGASQGKGLGKTLMKTVLDRCDAEGMPAYLESSSAANVPIYRSVGFEVLQEIHMRADSPTMYAMWRAPIAP